MGRDGKHADPPLPPPMARPHLQQLRCSACSCLGQSADERESSGSPSASSFHTYRYEPASA
eukprot:4388866-Karenia_brevis.AAC.1